MSPAPTPLQRRTLTRQLHQAILEEIENRDLGPGDQLPSTGELAETYGVSRPVVREALSSLQSVGIIDVSNGRNAVVRPLDGHLVQVFLARALQGIDRPLTSLMEVRSPLEVQAARLAATRRTEAECRELQAQVDQMDGLLGDASEYVRLDVELHRRIAELSGNPALLWICDAVRGKVFESMTAIRRHREVTGRLGDEHTDHRQIVDRIVAGDAEGAAEAMRTHLDSTAELAASAEAAEGSR